MGIKTKEEKVRSIIKSVVGVDINGKARTRHNSIAKKLFVFLCENNIGTPYTKVAKMINRSDSLIHVYRGQFKDIKYDKVLLNYYNECLNKYNECR